MEMLEIVLILIVIFHMWLCPFTKVEESFNMQAVHDIIYHKADLNQYDHHEFPGVVPRTFICPLILSYLSFPAVSIARLFDASKFVSQIIARGSLGIVTSICLINFSNAVKATFGNGVKQWFLLVTVAQFHLLFYASRPLANTFALAIVLLALSSWLKGNNRAFLWLSGGVICIVRFDTLLLLLPITVLELVTRRMRITTVLKHCIPAAVIFIGVTVIVDSHFWGKWLWPEGRVIWYNTVLNKSVNWGTQPFLWYFYSALPRLLGPTFHLLPLGLYTDRRLVTLAAPAFLFVFLFSFLPHKELRFIFYDVPLLNVVIATTLSRLWINQSKSFIQSVQAYSALALIVINIAMSTMLVYVSHHNYPGGVAMKRLHEITPQNTDVNVHIDVYTAQTGVTRFTQLYSHWRYNKTEDLSVEELTKSHFTHLLVGGSKSALNVYTKRYKVVAEINGFDRVSFSLDHFPPLSVEIEPKIWILKRRSDS